MPEQNVTGQKRQHISHSVPPRPNRPRDVENERIKMVDVVGEHGAIILDAEGNRNPARLVGRYLSIYDFATSSSQPVRSIAISSRAKSRDLSKCRVRHASRRGPSTSLRMTSAGGFDCHGLAPATRQGCGIGRRPML